MNRGVTVHMFRDPRDRYYAPAAHPHPVAGQRVRDAQGLTGVLVAMDPAAVPRSMAAVLYDAPGLRAFGPILTPSAALTFLTEAGFGPETSHPTPEYCEAIADDGALEIHDVHD